MFELGGRPVDPDIGNLGQDLSLKENFDSAIFLQWHLFGIVQGARIQQPCHSARRSWNGLAFLCRLRYEAGAIKT